MLLTATRPQFRTRPAFLTCSSLRRRGGFKAVVSGLRQPRRAHLVVDLGGGLAPFFGTLEQSRADDDLVVA